MNTPHVSMQNTQAMRALRDAGTPAPGGRHPAVAFGAWATLATGRTLARRVSLPLGALMATWMAFATLGMWTHAHYAPMSVSASAAPQLAAPLDAGRAAGDSGADGQSDTLAQPRALDGKTGALSVSGQSSIPWMPATVTRYLPVIRSHCTGAADEELAQIVMLVESGGDPDVVNSSNAHGLMQIVPRWHPECAPAGAALLDPDANVECGCRFLDRLLASYDAGTAAMHYNSGSLITAEGQRYYKWVTGMAAERHDATSPTFEAWMKAGGSRLVAAGAQH